MKATTIGNRTVQQNDINWSKRILGKLALAHINTKTIREDLIPKIIPDRIPEDKLPINKLGTTIDSVFPKVVGKFVTKDCILNKTSLFALRDKLKEYHLDMSIAKNSKIYIC